jgi:hypothetical protein
LPDVELWVEPALKTPLVVAIICQSTYLSDR